MGQKIIGILGDCDWGIEYLLPRAEDSRNKRRRSRKPEHPCQGDTRPACHKWSGGRQTDRRTDDRRQFDTGQQQVTTSGPHLWRRRGPSINGPASHPISIIINQLVHMSPPWAPFPLKLKKIFWPWAPPTPTQLAIPFSSLPIPNLLPSSPLDLHRGDPNLVSRKSPSSITNGG